MRGLRRPLPAGRPAGLNDAEVRYAALRAALAARHGPILSEMKGFGASALSIDGRIFALLSRGRLVVKLPAARVDALATAGWGERWDMHRGRPAKEWFSVHPDHEAEWTHLAEEALRFVAPSPS
ncbi:TfoX/Sxy family protein [Muricoccus radiodurans]|uniref:TfoX/Sxy family protein n=1 Tax=Muricoccus radiodurans TaxID=2231721 RepID=UPI003CF240BA